MNAIVCPGVHSSELTESFLEGLQQEWVDKFHNNSRSENILVLPASGGPAYSAFHILQFLAERGKKPRDRNDASVPLIFIGFSAGVVGAIGAAWGWQVMGGEVRAFIALDGWGVPLAGNFPIHRMSHDRFTHWSSALLGSGEDSFYASPPVEHLELWRKPQTVQGWWVTSQCPRPEEHLRLSAAQFLIVLLERYGGGARG